jgi:hypothetical protein
MDFMNDYVFHLNTITKSWAAIPRDLYNEYWNDYNTNGVVKSNSIETLLEILYKTQGKEIEKKLNVK